jgi:hypothetical protein
MNLSIKFDCHAYLDNSNVCILEISYYVLLEGKAVETYEWLIIRKSDLSVRKMHIKTQDQSAEYHEKHFDLGYLKYDSSTGEFLETESQDLHPLENKDCSHVPEAYLHSVQKYLADVKENSYA